MTKTTWNCFAGAVLALGMAAVPALAQDRPAMRTMTSTYNVVDSAFPSTIPDEMTIAAAQRIVDLNLSAKECELAINRLTQIAEQQAGLDATADQYVWRTLLSPESAPSSMARGPESVPAAKAGAGSAMASAWDLLASDIGADKAAGLRSIVNPPPTYGQWMAYIDDRQRTIDSLLADLDRYAAMGPPTQVTTTTTITPTTTTTTRTVSVMNPPPPAPMVTPRPYVSVVGLVRLLEIRLNALRPSWENVGDSDLETYRIHLPETRFDIDKVGVVDRPPSAYQTAKWRWLKLWD